MNNKKYQKLITEPQDNLVALILSLPKIKKKENPNRPKSKHQMVQNKNGDWVIL